MARVKLETISAQEYARVVLPLTFELWGHGRDFARYADDFASVATSAYGRRRRFTVGLYDGSDLAASCKTYDREIRWGDRALRATGIGAVYTRPALRGRGYGTALLGALLDAERDAGRDVAYLYSDIHPAYYERLDFATFPSRSFTLRATALDGAPTGATPLEETDWTGVRRCFDALDARRGWAFRRTPVVWEWMRARWSAPVAAGTQSVRLLVRRGRSVVAYAFGRRIMHDDTFVVDDFAYDGEEGAACLPAVLRACAGDLRRVGGWLPPAPARALLPRGSVRARKDAIFMAVPLSPLGRAWWHDVRRSGVAANADATWNADHV